MRKIPRNLENPIDNVVIDLSEYVSTNVFRKLNFTPNGITTLSLIFGLLAVFFLSRGCFIVAVVFMTLSYWMDCVDGYYARKYDMVTTFGDMYDHIKDMLIFIMFITTLYIRNKHKLSTKQWLIVWIIIGIFGASFAAYFACQERYYDKLKDIPSLAWLTKLIKSKKLAEKCLKVFRFLGLGTFMLCLMTFTVWIEMK